MKSKVEVEVRRISVDLPTELIEVVDDLRKEWGMRRRGAVLERLLEALLAKDESNFFQTDDRNDSQISEESIENIKYNENALVIINNKQIEIKELTEQIPESFEETQKIDISNQGIELPGFIGRKTKILRNSLEKSKTEKSPQDSFFINIKLADLQSAHNCASDHWQSLYGNKPTANVIEAAMAWLARDIWPQIDGTENISFTWSAANKIVNSYCIAWKKSPITFENVIVIAGILEDPFSSEHLSERIPTLIRRFVNKFKRSQNVTSFQTLESTMTVHGALKLLGLPTYSGSSLSLLNIREAYKDMALKNHPDAGGSTESMRRLNEAYQLLKDLYKKKN